MELPGNSSADEAERVAVKAAVMLPSDAFGFATLFGILRDWLATHHGLPGLRAEQIERSHLLLHAMASAGTIGEAAALLARFRRLVWGDRGVRVAAEPAGIRLILDQPARVGAAGLLGELWSLSLLLAELEMLAGGRLDRVRGSVRPPEDPRFLLTPLLFDRPLDHGSDELVLFLPRAVLTRPVVARADMVTAFLAQVLPRTVGGAGSVPAMAPLVSAMIRAGRTRADAPATTLANIAVQLAASEPTIRRRITAEGTSFRSLRERVLDDLATSWLREGAAVETVAARLGYSDGWSFRRAFHRRRGCSPTAFRRAPA